MQSSSFLVVKIDFSMVASLSRKLLVLGCIVLSVSLGGLPLSAELPADHFDRRHFLGVLLDGR